MLLLLGVGLCYLLGFGRVLVFDWAFGRFEYKFYFLDQKEKLSFIYHNFLFSLKIIPVSLSLLNYMHFTKGDVYGAHRA